MGILERLLALNEHKPGAPAKNQPTLRVALGALLSLVSRADGKVTEPEQSAKRAILARRGYAGPEEQEEIFSAAREALAESVDWEAFTREINRTWTYAERVQLIQDLFAVAWADHELTNQELETIRKIANLLWLSHEDFISAKLGTRPSPPPGAGE